MFCVCVAIRLVRIYLESAVLRARGGVGSYGPLGTSLVTAGRSRSVFSPPQARKNEHLFVIFNGVINVSARRRRENFALFDCF